MIDVKQHIESLEAKIDRYSWGGPLPPIIVTDKNVQVATVECNDHIYGPDDDINQEAMNARDNRRAKLFAAAPDLLSACAAMLCTWGSDDEDAIIAARDQARAAIVKATEPTS